MVIDLRLKSDAQHRVLDTDAGIVVQVDFPKLPPGTQLKVSVPQPPQAETKKRRRAAPEGDAVEDESY